MICSTRARGRSPRPSVWQPRAQVQQSTSPRSTVPRSHRPSLDDRSRAAQGDRKPPQHTRGCLDRTRARRSPAPSHRRSNPLRTPRPRLRSRALSILPPRRRPTHPDRTRARRSSAARRRAYQLHMRALPSPAPRHRALQLHTRARRSLALPRPVPARCRSPLLHPSATSSPRASPRPRAPSLRRATRSKPAADRSASRRRAGRPRRSSSTCA